MPLTEDARGELVTGVVPNGMPDPLPAIVVRFEGIEHGLSALLARLAAQSAHIPYFPNAIENGGMNGDRTSETAPPVDEPREEDRAREAQQPKRRKRKLPKTLTREEVSALLEACNVRVPTGLRDHCMMLAMYEAGLRIGEVRRLRSRDVDLERGEIRIYDGKGGDGTAYFDPEGPFPLRLKQWRRVRREVGVPAGSPLFCSVRKPVGSELNERTVQQMMKRRAEKAGVDPARVTPHRLRHTFATELLDEGRMSIYDVSKLLRHADLSSTEVYLHVRDAHLRAKMRARRR